MFVLPAFASSLVTVAELEQKLAADRGKPDAEVAQHLSDFELRERLSETNLARLESKSPGARTSQELRILADESAFLSLPSAEIPAIPSPDMATQRQIMGRVVSYVSKTIHQLPNFSATRVTTHFEETPQIQTEGHASQYLALHETGAFKATVLYRDGQEVVDTGKVNSKNSKQQAKGLRDWGEFGPILSTVFLDAARSDLRWSHWEKIATSTQAVFQYAVAPSNSHYRVNYCCVPGTEAGGDPMAPFDHIAGYHGEITVDPQRGSILRLTVEADLKPTDPVSKANIMVEYGPVEIGGQSYICASRSVASSTALSINNLNGDFDNVAIPGPPQKLLNDIAFEQYHMFRSDMRMVSGDEANQQEHPSTPSPPPTADEATKAPSVSQEPEHAEAVPPSSPSQSAPPTETPVVAPAVGPPSEPRRSVPSTDTRHSPIDQAPAFRTTSREVVVDVVVTKGNGEPVHGLARQGFEIFENGKPQPIDFFDEHTQHTRTQSAPTEMPDLPPDMQTNVPPAPPSDAVNVLLIDTLNTATQDQAYVRRQIVDFLSRMQPGTRIAIFVLGAQLRCLQGFTSDSSALLAALHDPRNGLHGEKNTFLKTSGDRANDAADLATLQAMQTSPAAIEALRSALEDAGAHDFAVRTSMTFDALVYLGHYLAGIPGRKNLIWFAGSFPLVIFPTADQFARMEQNPKLPGYVDRVKTAADLFTVSQTAVYPISVEGMMTEHIAEADFGGPGAGAGPGHVGTQTSDPMSPFNAGASERASTLIAMEQLAASSGGKAYYNSNDLNAAMRRAIDDGANYYTIGYAPAEKKMDGSFRQIEVRLAHGKFKLAYRHGYNADDASTSNAKSSVDPLSGLLQLGLPGATGVLYGVSAEPSATQPSPGETYAGQNPNLKGPVTRYAVNFVIRSQDLALKSGPQGGRRGKFLLGLKAYDRDGNAQNWEGDVESLEIKPDEFDSIRKSGIPAHLNIDIPTATEIHLVTAVYDLDSGEAGTQEIRLHLAQAPGSQSPSSAINHP
jgi:VWFA-related protein